MRFRPFFAARIALSSLPCVRTGCWCPADRAARRGSRAISPRRSSRWTLSLQQAGALDVGALARRSRPGLKVMLSPSARTRKRLPASRIFFAAEPSQGAADGGDRESTDEKGSEPDASTALLLPLAGEGGPAKRGRMREAQEEAVGDPPHNAQPPHPTRLRRATFSRSREKERPRTGREKEETCDDKHWTLQECPATRPLQRRAVKADRVRRLMRVRKITAR